MRLTTIRTAQGTSAARVEADRLIEVPGFADVGQLLENPDWRSIADRADGVEHAADAQREMLIPRPSKVLCVGLNYRNHILEMGRALPEYPTIFAKFADTLTAPFADIVAVAEESSMDWEGELAVIIGSPAYRVGEADARRHIAGYAVANDISMRSWQNRTLQWLQGKMWARSTPVGPDLVTADAFDWTGANLQTRVNGRTVQEADLSDLLFQPEQLVAYLSTIIPLNPGDIILTGTPGGVGHARTPAEHLVAGDTVEVEISDLGALRNTLTESR